MKVDVEQRGHVLLIGINRPEKRNAFDLEMLTQLVLAFGEYERDDDLRCALVFAHGDHFTLGRFFLGVVRDDDAAGGQFLRFDRLDHDAVMERLDVHA